ncbi:MAG: nuclear transport factor 2 family protein [Dokdonella sp.]
MERHASYFAPDVEFYHDTGGVTWTRDDMIANTRKYACGNYTRELVAGTLQVYPIKDFGAVARGTHRFCATDTDNCDGIADFVFVWRHRSEQWQVTRALSFGHRANK